MATQIAINTDEIVIRYRQPYVSEALNRKAVSEHAGIQKGFRLTNNGAAANQIILAVDEQAGVSAMHIKNDANPEFSVTWVRKADLPVNAPLTAGWHHLFVDHGYVFGSETVASMTWYSSAEVADPATLTPGMYIGSIAGVAAGQNVVDFASTYAISDGTILKRATASTDSGARTRVRGDNEEPVYFTDFNSRQGSPVDLTSGLKQTLTAKIMTDEQLANDNMYGAVNNLVSYTPETSGHALLIWRRAGDSNNRGNAQGVSDAYVKDYSIPAYIPMSNDSGSTKVRLFVRYKASRNNALRFADPASNVWALNLNFTASRDNDNEVTVSEIVGRDVAVLTSNSLAISGASITLDHTTNQYIWASLEATIPTVDENGAPIRLNGASVNISVPDMLEGEAIAIDRLLVESDVRPAIDPVDGAQRLGPVLGRFSAAGLDSLTTDSVLHPYSKGLAIVRGGDIPMPQATARTVYGIELVDHNLMVGLPLRKNDGTALGVNREEDDFSLVVSDNLQSSLQPLENLFRQSNLVINAPGQYDTSTLITLLEANGSTVPDALRAPQRAGLTVNNGNVVIKAAKGSIRTDLTTSGGSPSHETGQLISDGIILNGGVRFGALDDGQFLAGWSSRAAYIAVDGDYSVDFDCRTVLYLDALVDPIEANHVVPLFSSRRTPLLTTGMDNYNLSLVASRSTTQNLDIDSRRVKSLKVLVVDSDDFEYSYSALPDLTPAEGTTPDAVVAGLRAPIREVTIGSADINSASATRFLTRSELGNGVRGSIGVDFPNSLYGDSNDIVLDSTVPAGWTGEGLLSVGLGLSLDAKWDTGALVLANDITLRGQFIKHADLDPANPLLPYAQAYAAFGPQGFGVEIKHEVNVAPFSDIGEERQIDFANSLIILDLGPTVIASETSEVAVESSDDFDEPASAMSNILAYSALYTSTGAVVGLIDAVDPTFKFGYQILADADPSSNYPDFPHLSSCAHYRHPMYRLTHRIFDAFGNMRGEGEFRVNAYDWVLRQSGLQNADGTPNYGASVNYAQYRGGYVSALKQATFNLNLFNYVTADPLGSRIGDWTAMQSRLATVTGDNSADFSVSNSDYRHTFGVGICYDASFGAKALKEHPIALAPKVANTVISYRRRNL